MVSLGGLGSVFKNIPILNTISNVATLIEGIKTGDLGKILSSASQLAMTYATGGTSALFQQAAGMIADLAAQQIGGAAGSGGAGGQLGIGGASDLMSQVLTNAMSVETALATLQLIGDKMGMAQKDIDAAQGAFADMVGEDKLANTNYREAGFADRGSDGDRRSFFGGYKGNRITSGERAEGRANLGQLLSNQGQSPIADMVGALIAGPNAGPAQLGSAMGMIGGVQNAFNNFAFAMFNQMMEEMRSNLNTDANGNRQAGAPGAGGGAPGAGGAAGAGAGGAGGATGGASASGGIGDLGGASGGGSILMKIAKALGEAMDEKMEKMAKTADELGGMGEVDEKNQSKYGEKSAELTALGQELKILQESLNNTLKSIGEATSGLARKQ